MSPFWEGFFSEIEKKGQDALGIAAEVATAQPLATAAAVGVPVAVGAIGLKRAIQRRRQAAKEVVEVAKKVPKTMGKGKAALIGAGLVGGGYLAGKFLGGSSVKS